jgi:predicted metal-dependent phosphoesterase TrpH
MNGSPPTEVHSIRVDLHTHTRHSSDAFVSPEQLVERAREVGLDRVAVTDHGEIEGALVARVLDPSLIIVGEEIRCRCRTEIIGLFLTRRIPQGLPLPEVVERIRDQDGLIYAPHPFAYAVLSTWHARRSLEVADVVEVCNSRAFLPGWNRRAAEAAERRGLWVGAGSDAHFVRELGRAWTEMPPFATTADFREALARARPVLTRLGSPFLHLATAAVRFGRPFRGHRAPLRAQPTTASTGAASRGGPAIG